MISKLTKQYVKLNKNMFIIPLSKNLKLANESYIDKTTNQIPKKAIKPLHSKIGMDFTKKYPHDVTEMSFYKEIVDSKTPLRTHDLVFKKNYGK